MPLFESMLVCWNGGNILVMSETNCDWVSCQTKQVRFYSFVFVLPHSWLPILFWNSRPHLHVGQVALSPLCFPTVLLPLPTLIVSTCSPLYVCICICSIYLSIYRLFPFILCQFVLSSMKSSLCLLSRLFLKSGFAFTLILCLLNFFSCPGVQMLLSYFPLQSDLFVHSLLISFLTMQFFILIVVGLLSPLSLCLFVWTLILKNWRWISCLRHAMRTTLAGVFWGTDYHRLAYWLPIWRCASGHSRYCSQESHAAQKAFFYHLPPYKNKCL